MPKYDWEDTERDISEILQDFLYGIVPQEKYQESEAIRKRILKKEQHLDNILAILQDDDFDEEIIHKLMDYCSAEGLIKNDPE